MKKPLLCCVGVLLCFLIASPQMLAATSMKIVSSDVISIETSCSATAVKAFNMTFPANEYVTVETLGNGTREVKISVNVTVCRYCYVDVTMRTTIPTSSQQTATPCFTPKKYYPGKLPDQNLSSSTDYLKFLSGGDYNGTDHVSYDHDDNYNVYYPRQWQLNYSLPDATYPEPRAQQTHVHLPNWLMTDWYNGVVDTSTVVGIIFAAAGGVMSVIGGILGLNIVAVIAGISAIIGALLAWEGYTQQNWIRDVVTESNDGDGWTWIWGAKVIPSSLLAFIVEPPVWGVYDDNTLAQVLSYHRVGVMIYGETEFYQSWGAQRDSPQQFTVDFGVEKWVNPGIFDLSPVCR
jgi:hypothetical protein